MSKRIAAHDRRRYVLYARGHREPDEHPRIFTPMFEDPSRAKIWLTKFLGSYGYERVGNRLNLTDTKFSVEAAELDEIFAAEDIEWTMPDSEAKLIARFLRGTWDEDHTKPVEQLVEVVGEGEDGEPVVVAVTKGVKAKKEAKPKKAGKPDGYITIGELCTKWNIKPLHARTCLRASDLVKPDFGWAFAPADVPKIKKLCGVK